MVRGKHARICVGVAKRLLHEKLICNSTKGGWQGPMKQSVAWVVVMQWVFSKSI